MLSYFFRNGKNGSIIPQATVQAESNTLKKLQNEMDELVDEGTTSGHSSPDLKTGLRWAGFTPETDLQKALMFWRYNFENGIEPDVIDSFAYGYTDEDGKTLVNNFCDPHLRDLHFLELLFKILVVKKKDLYIYIFSNIFIHLYSSRSNRQR